MSILSLNPVCVRPDDTALIAKALRTVLS